MIWMELLKRKDIEHNCIAGSHVEYNGKKIFSIKNEYKLLSDDEKIKVLDFILNILYNEKGSYNI